LVHLGALQRQRGRRLGVKVGSMGTGGSAVAGPHAGGGGRRGGPLGAVGAVPLLVRVGVAADRSGRAGGTTGGEVQATLQG